jgi:membrane associated rhomboid family serine protease
MAGDARKPVFNLPGVVLGVLALVIGIQLLRDFGLSEGTDSYVLRALAFVPGQITFAFDPDVVARELTRLASLGDRQRVVIGQFLLGVKGLQFWTPVTYSLLHADWTHLGFNALWLIAFGSPVALRIGIVRFLALFIVTSVAGALAHYLIRPVDLVPVIGASAAVSGLTAAALRFVFQPDAPLGPQTWRGPLSPDEAVRQPALSLSGAVRDRRVIQFAAVWLIINLAIGLLALPLGLSDYAVAWEAHIGGFAAGFLLFGLFDRRFAEQSDWLDRR